MNNQNVKLINDAGVHFRSLDLSCTEWDGNVRNNNRICKTQVFCRLGINKLLLYSGSPLMVIGKLVLYPVESKNEPYYLGSTEAGSNDKSQKRDCLMIIKGLIETVFINEKTKLVT